MGAEEYRYAKRGAWAGIIVKAALAVGFGAAGLFGHSTALLAAAGDSLGDTLSSFAVLVGLTVAAALPDREHPYGHGKAEPVAGKAVAIVLILVAIAILSKSVWSLIQEKAHPLPEAFTVYVAIFGIVVHEALYRYQNRIAMKVHSTALRADAWNHRADALSGMVVLVGVAGARFGGPQWAFLDHAAGGLIGLAILYVGAKLFRQTALELMDTRLPEEQMTRIHGIIETTDGVLGVDLIRARRSGLVVFLDVHIEVDKGLTVEAGHNIATLVRRKVKAGIPHVADVLVHVEPYYDHVHTDVERF